MVTYYIIYQIYQKEYWVSMKYYCFTADIDGVLVSTLMLYRNRIYPSSLFWHPLLSSGAFCSRDFHPLKNISCSSAVFTAPKNMFQRAEAPRDGLNAPKSMKLKRKQRQTVNSHWCNLPSVFCYTGGRRVQLCSLITSEEKLITTSRQHPTRLLAQ